MPAALVTYMVGEVASNLVAAGSTQGTALLLSADVNEIVTAAASTGVRLPDNTVAVAGDSVIVFNAGANSVSLYPAAGDTINTNGVNAAFTLATGARTICYKVSNTRWSCI